MASQTCDQCGSIVAKDEQFCPSCGSFIDPMTTSKPRSDTRGHTGNVISVSSDGPGPGAEGAYEEFSLSERPPATRPQTAGPPPGNGNGADVACPSCGAVNPGNNRHCQECGARLRQGPLPMAPRPAVQATAGVRAALAISGLLLGVIVIALLFNIFTGPDPSAAPSTSSTTTTAPVILEAEPIDILSETCDPPGIGSLICANLTSGTNAEYQVSWEETANDGVLITLTFREPIAITEIQWSNITDPIRFRQNYRAQGLVIVAQDSLVETPAELQDQPGLQIVPYVALSTTTLQIKVVSTFEAEVVDDNRYDELAIDEIVVVGRPATPTTSAGADG